MRHFKQGNTREPAGAPKNRKPVESKPEPKCAICKERERVWLWQPAGPSDDLQCVFAYPGEQIRGFPAIACCDHCHDKIIEGRPVVFEYKTRRYRCAAVDNHYEMEEL